MLTFMISATPIVWFLLYLTLGFIVCGQKLVRAAPLRGKIDDLLDLFVYSVFLSLWPFMFAINFMTSGSIYGED